MFSGGSRVAAVAGFEPTTQGMNIFLVFWYVYTFCAVKKLKPAFQYGTIASVRNTGLLVSQGITNTVGVISHPEADGFTV
jgi:hypothetical protein